MLDKDKLFKVILGTLVPVFVILFVAGFCLLMIGYHVGSQTNTVQIIWSLVIAGWVFFGVGLIGYFTMFTIVLVRRYLKKKQPTNGVVEPNASLESHAIRK